MCVCVCVCVCVCGSDERGLAALPSKAYPGASAQSISGGGGRNECEGRWCVFNRSAPRYLDSHMRVLLLPHLQHHQLPPLRTARSHLHAHRPQPPPPTPLVQPPAPSSALPCNASVIQCTHVPLARDDLRRLSSQPCTQATAAFHVPYSQRPTPRCPALARSTPHPSQLPRPL